MSKSNEHFFARLMLNGGDVAYINGNGAFNGIDEWAKDNGVDKDNVIEIAIGNNCNSIGDYALSNLKLLSAIQISNNVQSVGDGALSFCPSLHYVDIGTGVSHLPKNLFCGDNNLSIIKMRSSKIDVDESALPEGTMTKIIVNSPTEINGTPIVQDISEAAKLVRSGHTVCRYEFGDSMFPILCNGEYAIITPYNYDSEISVGDSVLCTVMDGRYLMTHRVIEVLHTINRGTWYKIGSTGTEVYGWTRDVIGKAISTKVFENKELVF